MPALKTAEAEYRDDETLRKRQHLYAYTEPRLDLTEVMFDDIPFDQIHSILDVGCGDGAVLIQAFQKTHATPAVGIDISPGMIGASKKQANGLPLTFFVADAENLPFPENSFDLVICRHTLFHIENIARAVEEAYRCLKPGGIYLVSLNSRESRQKLLPLLQTLADRHSLSLLPMPAFRVTIEDIENYMGQFTNKHSSIHRNEINLKDPAPYCAYIDTLRPHFSPYPNEEIWQHILREATASIQDEITQDGAFREPNAFGVYVGIKEPPVSTI